MAGGQIKLNGVKRGGELKLHPAMDEAKRRWIASLKDETPIEITLSKITNHKSQKQLGAYFGLMLTAAIIELDDRGYDTSFILRIDKPTGIPITKDGLKDYLYSVCPIYRNGESITLSKANMEEAAKHYDDCRNFLASQWGIVIPDPDPMYKQQKQSGGGAIYPQYRINGKWKGE
jgi:hypothetical protein